MTKVFGEGNVLEIIAAEPTPPFRPQIDGEILVLSGTFVLDVKKTKLYEFTKCPGELLVAQTEQFSLIVREGKRGRRRLRLPGNLAPSFTLLGFEWVLHLGPEQYFHGMSA
jgi:hypothetical protein